MSTLAASNLKNASSGSNNIVLNTDGTTTIAAPSNIIKSGTAVASTSGTSIDFTGIPSWVKRVTVMFDGVSTSGTSKVQVQLGAGSVESTGYNSATCNAASATLGSTTTSSTGLLSDNFAGAANLRYGSLILSLRGSNTWTMQAVIADSSVSAISFAAGSKAISGALDRIRITTVNGTDTFDAGTINILYEG